MEASLRWDGDPITFPEWEEEALTCLRQGGVDGLALHTRKANTVTLEEAYGDEISVTGLSGQELEDTQRVNNDRQRLIQAGQRDHCLALISYIAPSVRGIVVDASDRSLRCDPDKLWKAINERIQVTTAHIGPMLMQELGELKWNSKSKDGSRMTMVKQIELMISKYQKLHLKFRAAPVAFQVTEEQLIGSFCTKLPKTGTYSGIYIHIAEYRKQVKLADLLRVIRPHAIDADLTAPTDTNAFMTVTQEQSRFEKLLEKIEALEKKVTDQQSRKGSRERNYSTRRMNKEAGQIQDGDKWCKIHGWQQTHDDNGCYVQKKNKKHNK